MVDASTPATRSFSLSSSGWMVLNARPFRPTWLSAGRVATGDEVGGSPGWGTTLSSSKKTRRRRPRSKKANLKNLNPPPLDFPSGWRHPRRKGRRASRRYHHALSRLSDAERLHFYLFILIEMEGSLHMFIVVFLLFSFFLYLILIFWFIFYFNLG